MPLKIQKATKLNLNLNILLGHQRVIFWISPTISHPANGHFVSITSWRRFNLVNSPIIYCI